MGVLLGIFAKAAFLQGLFTGLGYPANAAIDPEIGLPLFIRSIFPIGFLGLLLAAYFSAILSTADSCIMAASGNFVTDILGGLKIKVCNEILISQNAELGRRLGRDNGDPFGYF